MSGFVNQDVVKSKWGGARVGAGRKPKWFIRLPNTDQERRTRLKLAREQRRVAQGMKIGRGGARAGSGRKRKEPRGETCANPSCLKIFEPVDRQTFCSRRCARIVTCPKGPRGGVRHTIRECRVCRRSFSPRYQSHIACSRACGKAWVVSKMTNAERSAKARLARQRHTKRRKRLIGGKVEVGRWRRICERDQWTCWICRQVIDPLLTSPDRWGGTADHVVPLAHGGADEDCNLRAAHLTCNSRRGAGKFIPKEAA